MNIAMPCRARRHSFLAIALVLLTAACGRHAWMPPSVAEDSPSDGDRSILAGEWQYEDGAVVTLRLDARGNGSYAWKDGRFETTRLEDHTWVGKWYQRDNDREGAFVIQLSPDYTEGQGTWWYLRIGDDFAPAQKGGSFHLTRKPSLTNLSETPAAPQ